MGAGKTVRLDERSYTTRYIQEIMNSVYPVEQKILSMIIGGVHERKKGRCYRLTSITRASIRSNIPILEQSKTITDYLTGRKITSILLIIMMTEEEPNFYLAGGNESFLGSELLNATGGLL